MEVQCNERLKEGKNCHRGNKKEAKQYQQDFTARILCQDTRLPFLIFMQTHCSALFSLYVHLMWSLTTTKGIC